MGTSVDPAYIERLQQDIIIACHRLEETGHESLVITVSDDSHLIFGSEKGKSFLENSHAIIRDFMFYCQHQETVVKVEREDDDNVFSKKKRPVDKSKLGEKVHDGARISNITEELEQDRNDNVEKVKDELSRVSGGISLEVVETNVFDEDTDDYDETENFSPLQDKLESEITPVIAKPEDKLEETASQANREKTMSTNDNNNCVTVKKENIELDEKLQHSLKQRSAKVVLTGINIGHNNALKTGSTRGKSSKSRKKVKRKGVPSCDICDKKLATWAGVSRHKICYHTEGRTQECQECGKMFKLLETLQKHIKVVHNSNKEYNCEYCGETFKSAINLKQHMNTHETEKSAICPECGKTLRNKYRLNMHMKHFHTELKFKCQTCGAVYFSAERLSRHELAHTSIEDELKCKLCGKIFPYKSKVDRHMATHTKGRLKPKPKELFRCEICGKKSGCRANFNKHIATHSSVKPFICETCGKTFTSKQYLDNHVRLHTGEKPYNCTFEGCGKTFRTYDNLSKHAAYHNKDYPFICDYCGRKFKEKSCMRTHVRKRHVLEYPWPCDYCSEKFKTIVRFKTHIVRFHVDKKHEVAAKKNIKFWSCEQCPKVFGSKDDWDQHMNVHLGRKPFKCAVCLKAFSSKSNLLQHKKMHSDEVRLKCRLCYKTYKDPNILKVHMKNRHNRDVDLEDVNLSGGTAVPWTKGEDAQENHTSMISPATNAYYEEEPEVSHFSYRVYTGNISGIHPLRIEYDK